MTLLIFIIGLIFGSFFNVVGLRIPIGKSIMFPRSSCPKCHCILSPPELIPVLSYVWQKRSCRRCGLLISPIYPFTELSTACLFAAAYAVFGLQFPFLKALILISLLSIIFISDVVYMIIPNKILLFFTCLFFIEWLFLSMPLKLDALIGAAVSFILMMIVAAACRGGIGGGDIKLFTLLGFALGLKGFFLTFFLSLWLGTIGGLLGMLLGKVKRRQPFPFGPFIAFASLLALFYGDVMFKFYLSFFR
ncbi:prepilin peptidase [Bacillus aerolatus]|uniref:Prepilin peptidase n=1 Tax=Bacillus aerolatus TaxID=2653354 RepID=A0A6I1FUK1_9BACI|nr:A24 family peptidase [Bacillus aerolatus]KAB7708613.1 prepilin peptidase [Bacillus aerolatus]